MRRLKLKTLHCTLKPLQHLLQLINILQKTKSNAPVVLFAQYLGYSMKTNQKYMLMCLNFFYCEIKRNKYFYRA